MERCESRVQPRSHIHTPGNVGECERMSPHIPKWTPILGVGISITSWIFKEQFERSKLIGKLLRLKCLKWGLIIHLSTYNTSYGLRKGWESKCQFDSRPLKVRNRLDLHVCRGLATYFGQDLDKGYNFFLNLASIESLHKKLLVSIVVEVPISKISKLLTWEY
jgi:hypothetical protein